MCAFDYALVYVCVVEFGTCSHAEIQNDISKANQKYFVHVF